MHTLTYEYPLTERVAFFLRLEFLFHALQHHSLGEGYWDGQYALSALVDILNNAKRNDIHAECTKELTRLEALLKRIPLKGEVDTEKLQGTLQRVDTMLLALQESSQEYTSTIAAENYLLQSFERRSFSRVGPTMVDLPCLRSWVNSPVAMREEIFRSWYAPLYVIMEAVELVLEILRLSKTVSQEMTNEGFFERLFQNRPQLIQIIVPEKLSCFPEISANRRSVSLHFMTHPRPAEAPQSVRNEVNFIMHCCAL